MRASLPAPAQLHAWPHEGQPCVGPGASASALSRQPAVRRLQQIAEPSQRADYHSAIFKPCSQAVYVNRDAGSGQRSATARHALTDGSRVHDTALSGCKELQQSKLLATQVQGVTIDLDAWLIRCEHHVSDTNRVARIEGTRCANFGGSHKIHLSGAPMARPICCCRTRAQSAQIDVQKLSLRNAHVVGPPSPLRFVVPTLQPPMPCNYSE